MSTTPTGGAGAPARAVKAPPRQYADRRSTDWPRSRRRELVERGRTRHRLVSARSGYSRYRSSPRPLGSGRARRRRRSGRCRRPRGLGWMRMRRRRLITRRGCAQSCSRRSSPGRRGGCPRELHELFRPDHELLGDRAARAAGRRYGCARVAADGTAAGLGGGTEPGADRLAGCRSACGRSGALISAAERGWMKPCARTVTGLAGTGWRRGVLVAAH